jgi:hypothetical protein
MREAKIERLLSTPPSGFWVSKGFRRSLCIIAVVFSYFYLITLFIPISFLILGLIRDGDGVINLDTIEPAQSFLYSLANIIGTVTFLTPLILLTSFLLLRSSMRRITSLPDQYLDELEIANRDWAFKTGYLVIRRVGLALSAIGFITLFFLFVTRPRTWEWPSPKHPFQEVEDALDRFFGGLTQGGSLVFYFQVIALLTYVAYSFPIILLAWRESKFNEPMPKLEGQLIKEAPVFAKAYLKRILILVLGFIASICIGWLVPGSLLNGLAIMAIIVTVWFGMYVYVWSSIRTIEILKSTREKTSISTLALVWFVITQLLGISLAIMFVLVFLVIPQHVWGGGSPIGLLLILGALMVPAQGLSVFFVSNLSRQAKE